MARRKTRTVWTPALIAALAKQHSDRPDLSHAACNRIFAQKYGMTFLAAKAGYYNHITKKAKNVTTNINFVESNSSLSNRFNVASKASMTITVDELVAAMRFATQHGYTLVG